MIWIKAPRASIEEGRPPSDLKTRLSSTQKNTAAFEATVFFETGRGGRGRLPLRRAMMPPSRHGEAHALFLLWLKPSRFAGLPENVARSGDTSKPTLQLLRGRDHDFQACRKQHTGRAEQEKGIRILDPWWR